MHNLTVKKMFLFIFPCHSASFDMIPVAGDLVGESQYTARARDCFEGVCVCCKCVYICVCVCVCVCIYVHACGMQAAFNIITCSRVVCSFPKPIC